MRRSSAPSFLKSKVSPGLATLAKSNENSSNKNALSGPDPSAVRSTSRILSLLNGGPTIEDTSCTLQSSNSEIENAEDSKKLPDPGLQIQTPNAASSASEKIIFEAVYRKMTSKKHKTWEGDGTVQVEGRCAILKDDTGKEMGRNSKVKADVIFEEGTQLLIGGKEVELGSILQRQAVQQRAPSPPVNAPVAKKMKFTVRQHRDDDLQLPTPSASHQWKYNSEGLPVNLVVVEGFLARALRPHQREGIKFLYECVMGMRGLNPGQYWGALLADEMGLGKTLQCIALFWTLLNQKAYGRGGEIKRILIVAPRTLVDNWERDIYAWLGYRRVSVYKVNSKNSFQDYGKRLSKVAIASYETCVRQAAVVGSYEWDLLICDEAHCLKNPDTEKAKCMSNLNCRRRILLTGSPCQNNLMEFFELLHQANPGCLGTKEEFMTEYAAPIVRSSEPQCTEEEREAGEECSTRLKTLTSQFMLRRTAELLIPFLPSRQDLVVMCNASNLQKQIYQTAVSYWSRVAENPKCLGYQSGVPVLKAITSLRQISNHPALLKPGIISESGDENEQLDDGLRSCLTMLAESDTGMVELSGKLRVVYSILEQLKETNELKLADRSRAHNRDRVLIVSYFTQTLTMLENLCKKCNYKYLRLDGTTTQNARLPMVNEFDKKNSDTFVFLLSAKAGGTGLNLTGASRLILYDLDWNPANDAQALGRVWRGDQSRPVITYRLITAGTIEEKMFQRQIKKTGLNPTLKARQEHVKFSTEDLKDLFSFQEDETQNLTHQMLQCDCDGSGSNLNNQDMEDFSLFSHDTEEKNIPGIDQLMRWQHLAPYIDPSIMQDLELLYAQEFITFVFRTVLNSS